MNIVVDKVVAVLQVLTLADAVSTNQHVNLSLDIREQCFFFFGYGREEREDLVEIKFLTNLERGASLYVTSDESRMQSVFLKDCRRKVLIEILSGVTERRKYDDFLVLTVDGIIELVAQVSNQLLEFTVMLRRNVGKHNKQELEVLIVAGEIFTPRDVVNVGQ